MSMEQKIAQMVPKYSLDSDEEEEEQKAAVKAREYSASLAGWNDFFLKEELKRAIREVGFEHPSEVQVSAIPQALQGHDLLCQAKSGMGKTAVFTISILNRLELAPAKEGQEPQYETQQAIITCHARELAHQIFRDFKRIGRYFKKPDLRIGCYYGGTSVGENLQELRDPKKEPHIVIGTPGRLMDLASQDALRLKKCKFFVVDECDKVLGNDGMRMDVQDLFVKTPHKKQVMMFSATLQEDMKKSTRVAHRQRADPDCKMFLQEGVEILVDEGKLILHGLTQFYVTLPEVRKFDKLIHLLDTLAFNQLIIFVNKIDRAKKLTELLQKRMFNPICIHSKLPQDKRISNYDLFKANGSRVLVATDLFGRGIDIERVNLVINFGPSVHADFPPDRESYLHRVGRAGRFNTKGLAINFIRPDEESTSEDKITDKQSLINIQNGFQIKIAELPKELDASQYM